MRRIDAFIFFTIATVMYLFLLWFDHNKDMERHFCNTDKTKFYLLLYVKYSCFFIMVYNFKDIVTHLKA